MWLLIPILVVLAIAFVASGVLSALGGAWPWLLIGLGAWMFWHEDGRYRGRRRPAPVVWDGRRHHGRAESRQQPPRAKSEAPTGDARPEQPKKLSRSELPIDIQVKVEQIRRKVDVLLGYADRFPPFSQDLYLVRQTASEYLPRTINAFLALPLEAVDQPMGTTGRTAREELKAQLDLLDAKLDEIAQDLQRQDADRLLANRRFLESRFGERGNAKDGPSITGVA